MGIKCLIFGHDWAKRHSIASNGLGVVPVEEWNRYPFARPELNVYAFCRRCWNTKLLYRGRMDSPADIKLWRVYREWGEAMNEKATIQLIDSMMREHKAAGHRDLGDVKEWCKYCLALSDLKRKLEDGSKTKLAEIEERIEKLEDVTGVVRCPECRTTNVRYLWTVLAGEDSLLSDEYCSVFECEDCGKRFTH